MTKGIILQYGKTIKPIIFGEDICTAQLDVTSIDKVYNFGKDNISRECDYQWNDVTISMYAWTNGREKYINQHDLPPPIDTQLYYGDIIVIKHTNGVVDDLTEEEYNTFYEDSFGGFEDIVSNEEISSDEEPTQSDIDFIVSDHESCDMESSSEEEAPSDDSIDSEEEDFNSDDLGESSSELSKESEISGE